MHPCTHHDTVLGIQRHMRRLHCSNLLRASRSCQTTLPASRSAALSYEHSTTHSCFSCFECSAMQKINSSGYSTSTQANLNTTSIHFLQSLLPLSLSPGHIIKMTFPVRPLPVKHPSTPSHQRQSINCI